MDDTLRGGIMKDARQLEDRPPGLRLHGRQKELQSLLKCLRTASDRVRPIQVWVSGPPGSGKTSLAQLALEAVNRPGSVECVHVNCWRYGTLHAVVERIVTELRLLDIERIDAQYKLDRLRDHLNGRALIIALDEIDRMPSREREAVVYNLSSLGNVGLVCISYSRSVFFEMDRRVRSRLSPYILQLSGYDDDQLAEILERRSRSALHDGTWDERELREIAKLSHGDARVAVRALKQAAHLAGESRSSKLESQHVATAWRRVIDVRRTYLLDQLTKHHRVIYQVIRQKGPVKSANARAAYEALCRKTATQPVARRTFSHYVTRLIASGLITREKDSTWGNVQILRPSPRFHPSEAEASSAYGA